MYRLYKKNEILFAVIWILVYCLVLAPIRGEYGDGSIAMMIAVSAFAIAVTVFVKNNHLEEKNGLDRWPKNPKRYLYFIPLWILAIGNMWDGFSLSYTGMPLLYATASMALVGYVEEMLFRGFLFKAMLSQDGETVSIIVSSVTFGIGHIINLFAGQASLETFIQIIFAISWGFMLTMVCYKSDSLLPCIVAHSLVDVSSLFGADTKTGDMIYVFTTILVAIIYCVYLSRLKKEVR